MLSLKRPTRDELHQGRSLPMIPVASAEALDQIRLRNTWGSEG